MSVEPQTVRAWFSELLGHYPATEEQRLTIHDCRLRVRSNSRELLDLLARDLHPYSAPHADEADVEICLLEAPELAVQTPLQAFPPGPGKSVIKDEYVDLPDGRLLRKRLTGMVFCCGDGGHLAVGPCRENRNQVINFVNNRFIQWQLDRGYVLCHAAGVASAHGGLALAGTSGAGKSTLALKLLSRGLDYVSNDRLLIRRTTAGLQMLGVPKAPRVNPGTILNNPELGCLITEEERARFAALPPEELWTLEHKYDADIERCFGAGRVRLLAPLTGVVILWWRRDGGQMLTESIDLAERRDLLQRLMKPVGVHYRVPADYPKPDFSEQTYLDLLGDCPVLGCRGGVDFDRATDGCLELLGRAASAPAPRLMDK